MVRGWQRNALTWLILAVFAAPAFMGQGLHGLFGIEHSPFCDCHEIACHVAVHDAAHLAGVCSLDRGHTASADCVCGSCPICNYFASSLCGGPDAPVVQSEIVVCPLAALEVPAARAAFFWAFSARAAPVS
jgi:hypothetical protein